MTLSAWLLTGIVGVVCYGTGVLHNAFNRPKYENNGNIIVKFMTRYPSLAWLTLLIVTDPFFGSEYSIKTNKLTFPITGLLWLSTMEELIFRGLWFKLYPNECTRNVVISAVLSGTYYYIQTSNLMAFRYFGLLGLTYGFATRMYSTAELCMFRGMLYVVFAVA